MKNFKLLERIVLILLIVFIIQTDSSATLYSISNSITGSQSVPPVITNGSGTITGSYNDVTNALSITINFSELTGFTSVAHFHGPALPTANAGVVIGYTGFPSGVTSGTYSNNYTLTAAQEIQFLSNLLYSNIHTTFAGAGEIRGQVYPMPISSLNLTALIEGFYDENINSLTSDTVTVNVRQSATPYSIVGTKNFYPDNNGSASADYTGIFNGVNYYLQVLHRNGLETWSNTAMFAANSLAYDFTTSASQAFGNNLKLKGTRYCNYNGDVNQDGVIDGTDGSQVDNAAAEFLTGYVAEDCDGNDFVDGTDGSIVDNNASAFVSAVTP